MTTVLLVHADGVNGATTFTDVMTHTLTPTSATVITSPAPKFGTGAANFSTAGASRIVVNSPQDFNLRGQQFTIEAWAYFTASPSSVRGVVTQFGGSSNLGWFFGVVNGQLAFYWSTTGSDNPSLGAVYTPTLNTWIHLACDRDATNTVRIYANGVVLASGTVPMIFASTQACVIGNDNNNSRNFPGYLDEVRVIRGVAAYAGAFTPPTTAFTDAFGAGLSITEPPDMLGADGTSVQPPLTAALTLTQDPNTLEPTYGYTYVYTNVGIVWDITNGTHVILDKLPDVIDPSYPYPSAGNTVLGWSENLDTIVGVVYPSWYTGVQTARWNGHTGALTLLTSFDDLDVPGFSITSPYHSSADGSILLGWSGYQYGLIRWTGSGAMTPAELPPMPNNPSSAPSYERSYRQISSDGRVIAGSSVYTGATAWVDGVPRALAGHNFDTSQGYAISADGSTFLVTAGGYYSTVATGGGYARVSDMLFRPVNSQTYIRAVNANGSVIWSDYNNPGGYTDDLNTVGSGGYYGTFHEYYVLGQYQFCSRFAEDTFSPNPIAAGSAYMPDYNTGFQRALRATGTSTVLLDLPAPYLGSSVTGISGNGQIVSGNTNGPAPNHTPVPCYWDAAGNFHALPVPPEYNYQLVTNGVSRDGTKIVGQISTFTPYINGPPVPPAELALRLVNLPPQNLPANFYHIFAEWGSDFPVSFGQYSLSVWCCESVTLRWPHTDPVFGILAMTPNQVYAEFRDPTGVLLFTGTFMNPSPPDPTVSPILYHIGFAIDTEAQTATCWGNNTKWLSSDARFFTTGLIGNPSS